MWRPGLECGVAFASPTPRRTIRILQAALAVALWIAVGLGFRLSANSYLLLGIPLTAAFQLIVRRQPLRALWVRDAVAFRLGARGWIMATLLAAYPCYRLAASIRAADPGLETAWYLAAVAGAFPAAFALANFHRKTSRDLSLCLATAGAFGILLVTFDAVMTQSGHRPLGERFATGLSSLLLYIPVTFLLEEVSFRGAFDAHVHHPGESREYASAFFVSALWGLWHVPVAMGQKPLPLLVVGLLGVHCAVGVPLSLCWRRSGNLFVTCATHALIDAVRNPILM